MKVIFIRHGQTDYNIQGRHMGISDIPLNQTGVKDSFVLAAQIFTDYVEKNDDGLSLQKIFSSPLKRAIQTALILEQRIGVPFDICEELKERDFGNLTGKTWQEIEDETKQPLHSQDDSLNYDYALYGGESSGQVRARLRRFVQMLRESGLKKVLAVSHHGIIQLMYNDYKHTAYPEIDNGSVHIFDI